ncbi:hypothetical protein QL285_037862 [Trifolium repens]|nr:hypothetical protein QL285_037862 [Trifolium repens]
MNAPSAGWCSNSVRRLLPLLQQNTLQFESEPSSSTYTPYSQTHSIPYTHVEGDGEKGDDEDEADSEHEGIIEESENEEDYHDNIYDNDDDQTQSAYDPTPLSAYNPPPHMHSYAALPQWLTTLRYYQPNVIDILETLPNNSGPGLIFHRLFWSFKPLVKGFRFCKPLVQVDGMWLYGKYRGTLLLAVAQDGNNHIFPVAFAIVEDRHPSIKSAYENPQNGWTANTSTHVYCIRHIAQNFMREIKDKKHRKFVVNMAVYFDVGTPNMFRIDVDSTLSDLNQQLDEINCCRNNRKDDRNVTSVDYRKPSIRSDGSVTFSKMQLKNDDDVRTTFSIYFQYSTKGPIELDAKLTRSVDTILANLKHPEDEDFAKSFKSSSITAKLHSENSNPLLGNRSNPSLHYKPRNHSTPGTLTSYVLNNDMVRVVVTKVIYANAEVSVPTDEVATVGEAPNNFIQWPKRLLQLASNKKYDVPPKNS